MKIRTRFAPSPTGMMHVGNLRSAIFEYLIAKHNDGSFILRIEDTDQKRIVEGAVDLIIDTLNKCNLIPDEGAEIGGDHGPYYQSQRLDIYKKYAFELIESGKAYYCFCSNERLENLRKEADKNKVAFMYDGYCKNLSRDQINEKLNNKEPFVIRQVMPKEGISSYNDMVYGEIRIENKYLEEQILLKSDGFPTYNFANVIDDHLMEITHVIRGNEYLSSTPKYNLLYDSFGWEKPTYIHLPLVIDFDGKKLSKRHNAASFIDLYNKGYLPEGIVNYLILLGWSSPDNKEIFSLEEVTKVFKAERISKSASIYDIKKLNWINSHYMKRLSNKEYYDLVLPFINKNYDIKEREEWAKEVVLLYKNSIDYGEDILNYVDLFFNDNVSLNDEELAILKEEQVCDHFKEEIINSDWNLDNILKALEKTKEKTGISGKMLFMPIRIKITGVMHGPELGKTIYLIGKEKVLKRL